MAGGPPSADITYKLPEAQSAICFALPLNRDIMRAFLRKELPNGRSDQEQDRFDVIIRAYRIEKEIANFLQERGHKAAPLFPNNKYREDIPGWQIQMHPELSFRYVAVRSGVASFGWSGNVGIKGYGTAIVLGCLVTSAKLEPTDPILPEDSFCTQCKICEKVCAYRMFDREEEYNITLGGHEFSYAKRIDYFRCHIICGGFSGLDKSGKWSTWSPGRYDYPENKEEVVRLYSCAMSAGKKRPKNKYETSQGYDNKAIGSGLRLTCGNCQLICWGDPKETAENYRLLTNSGCVVQKEDGEMVVFPPDEAKRIFDSMNPKHKRLYYKNYKRMIRGKTQKLHAEAEKGKVANNL